MDELKEWEKLPARAQREVLDVFRRVQAQIGAQLAADIAVAIAALEAAAG
jgi:hypothetical protein